MTHTYIGKARGAALRVTGLKMVGMLMLGMCSIAAAQSAPVSLSGTIKQQFASAAVLLNAQAAQWKPVAADPAPAVPVHQLATKPATVSPAPAMTLSTPLPALPGASLTQQIVSDALRVAQAPVAPVSAPAQAAAPISTRPTVSRTVKATAYNSEVGQTDSSPFVTATGTRVRPGVIALSRDLLRIFPYGSRVTIRDSAGQLTGRVFLVEDTMNVRMVNTIDIWMPSRAQALRWGSRTVTITALR